MSATRYMFFDPHPGMAGAAVPIPEEIRIVAAALDGKKFGIQRVLKAIRGAIAREKSEHFSIKVVKDCILLTYDDPALQMSHCWRVIRFKNAGGIERRKLVKR